MLKLVSTFLFVSFNFRIILLFFLFLAPSLSVGNSLEVKQKLQLEIWNLLESGDVANAEKLEKKVIVELQTGDFTFDTTGSLDGKSNQEARKVFFKNGITGILKKQMFARDGQSLFAAEAEVAAYRLDRLFGFNRVPITALRMLDGQSHSIQLYIDGLKPRPELSPSQISSLVFFDTLISEADRHSGNFGLAQGRLILIDHGYSFGFWTAKNYTHKTFEFDRPALSATEIKKIDTVSDTQVRLALNGLKFDEERINALLERLRDLRVMVGLAPSAKPRAFLCLGLFSK